MLNRLRRTFVAMFWGWVACNTFVTLWTLFICHLEQWPVSRVTDTWILFLIYSIPVIMAAWLLILLPVDCLIPQSSFLRKRRVAAGVGAIVGTLPFLILNTWNYMGDWTQWWQEVLRILVDTQAWLYGGAAAITGLTAALYLTSKHPRTHE